MQVRSSSENQRSYVHVKQHQVSCSAAQDYDVETMEIKWNGFRFRKKRANVNALLQPDNQRNVLRKKLSNVAVSEVIPVHPCHISMRSESSPENSENNV